MPFAFANRPSIECQPNPWRMFKYFSPAELYFSILVFSGLSTVDTFSSSRRSERLQSVHFPTRRPFKEPRARATPRRAMEKRTTSTTEDLDSGPPWLGLDWIGLAQTQGHCSSSTVKLRLLARAYFGHSLLITSQNGPEVWYLLNDSII